MSSTRDVYVIAGIESVTSGGAAVLLFFYPVDPDRSPGVHHRLNAHVNNPGAWVHTITTRFVDGGITTPSTGSGVVVDTQAVTVAGDGGIQATFDYEVTAPGFMVVVYTATGGTAPSPSIEMPVLIVEGDPPPTVPYPVNLPEDLEADFGIDIDVIEDLPVGFPLARGLRNLANALLRRLSTPPRYLADSFEDDAEYGWDCRALLNKALTDAQLKAELAKAQQQALLDDRVSGAQARYLISGAAPEQSVTLELDIDTETGPFRLVIGVNELTPTLLSVDTLE